MLKIAIENLLILSPWYLPVYKDKKNTYLVEPDGIGAACGGTSLERCKRRRRGFALLGTGPQSLDECFQAARDSLAALGSFDVGGRTLRCLLEQKFQA